MAEHWYLALFLFPMHLFLQASAASGTNLSLSRVEPLQDLYYALSSPQLKEWKLDTGGPCEEKWSGVSCAGSSVIRLNIEGNHFSGLIPLQLWSIPNFLTFPMDNFPLLQNESHPPTAQLTAIEYYPSFEVNGRLGPEAIGSMMAGVVLVFTGAALLFSIHTKQFCAQMLNSLESPGYTIHSLLDMSRNPNLVLIILSLTCIKGSSLSQMTTSHSLPSLPLVPTKDVEYQLRLQKRTDLASVSFCFVVGVLSIIMAGFYYYCKRIKNEKHDDRASRTELVDETVRNEQHNEHKKMRKRRRKKRGSRKREDNGDIVIGQGRLWVSTTEIGSGSDSAVFIGLYNEQKVAVKKVLTKRVNLVEREIDLLTKLKHRNIIVYHGKETFFDSFYIVLELCSYSLKDLICSQISPQICPQTIMEATEGIQLWKPNEKYRPSRLLLKLMNHTADGLSYLHSMGIIHRDIKPANIFIAKEDQNHLCAKLGDLGISKKLSDKKSSITKTETKTAYGTEGWQAPEVLNDGRQTKALDVFSLGLVFFYCITRGRHAFGEGEDCSERIRKNQLNLSPLMDQAEAEDIISKMLDINPDNRPSAEEVAKHPLFWEAGKRLKFLVDANGQLKEAAKRKDEKLLAAVDRCLKFRKKNSWKREMDKSFVDEMTENRKYNFKSVLDLLRFTRNTIAHKELPIIRAKVGVKDEELDYYFSSRFPGLFLKVYDLLLYQFQIHGAEFEDYKWR